MTINHKRFIFLLYFLIIGVFYANPSWRIAEGESVARYIHFKPGSKEIDSADYHELEKMENSLASMNSDFKLKNYGLLLTSFNSKTNGAFSSKLLGFERFLAIKNVLDSISVKNHRLPIKFYYKEDRTTEWDNLEVSLFFY